MKSFAPIFTVLALASGHQIYFSPNQGSGNQPAFNYQSLPGYKVSAFAQPQNHYASQSNQHLQQNGYSGQSQHQGFSYGSQSAGHGIAEQSGQEEYKGTGEGAARVLSHHYENNDHYYQYGYETDNGIKAQEAGQVQGKSLQVQGEYSYTGTDGQVYTVSYVADENGFRPQGAHLPTPPPIPEAIQKSLELVGANHGIHKSSEYGADIGEDTSGQYDDGQYHVQDHGENSHHDNQYDASLSGLRAPAHDAESHTEGW